MESQVQLGYSVPIENDNTSTNKKSEKKSELNFTHCNNNWSEWDGGKIGGKAIWLNPRDIPTNLTCTSTSCCPTSTTNNKAKLSLLVQLYCPADDEEENAFHRTIYVFICNICHGIRVLRCQLPKKNPFYVSQLLKKEEEVLENMHKSDYWKIELCSLCNQNSNEGIVSPDENNPRLSFCSNACHEEYQQMETPEHHTSTILLPESEIYVEEEPPTLSTDTNTDELLQDDEFDINDEDEEMTQSDINKWTHVDTSTGCSDSYTLEFQSRIHNRDLPVQNQCLRYNRWPSTEEEEEDTGPLWIQENHIPGDDNIPNCQYCGSPRLFEFQIMPQMLYYIKQKTKEATTAVQQSKTNLKEMLLSNESTTNSTNQNNLDWGVIAIYTCSKTCHNYTIIENGDDGANESNKLDKDLGAYMEEYAWIQPPPPAIDEES